MTSAQRWKAAKDFNKKDWTGLDFFNSGKAFELHTEDPHFTTAASTTTDDQAQKDTHTNPSAAQPQSGPQSSSATAVEVRPEAFEEALYSTEHLTPPVVFNFEETAATTSSTESTAQSSSDYQTFEKLIDMLPLNATIHITTQETLNGLTLQQIYKVASKLTVNIQHLAMTLFAKAKMIKLLISHPQSS